MLITLRQPRYVKWQCYANTNIHETKACDIPDEIVKFETAIVPQIGEILCFKSSSKKYRVQSVIREIRDFSEKFTVIAEPEVLWVDYYDYMKKYTHYCDKMKSDADPTKDISRIDEPVILPDNWDEWVRRANALTEYYITKTDKWHLFKKNGTLPINIISSHNYDVVQDIYNKLLNGYYTSDEHLYQEIHQMFENQCIINTNERNDET